MNTVVVFLGGPADLTRMAVPDPVQNVIKVAHFASRPATIMSDAMATLYDTAEYERQFRTSDGTLVYSWKGWRS